MSVKFKCPHCKKEIFPQSMLGSVMTEKKRKACKKAKPGAGRPLGSKNKK